MSDSQWDAKMRAFLKKTGDDFKRFGRDVKSEAERLMHEVKDPERQQKLREGLKDVGEWAKKTAEDVAGLVETGMKKAERVVVTASDRVSDFVVKESATSAPQAAEPAPAPTPPSPPPTMEEIEPEAPAKPSKTVGPRAKKKTAPKAASAKKTLGKKKKT